MTDEWVQIFAMVVAACATGLFLLVKICMASRRSYIDYTQFLEHNPDEAEIRRQVMEYSLSLRRSLVLNGLEAEVLDVTTLKEVGADPDAPRVVNMVVPDSVNEDDYQLALAVLRGDEVAARALADKVREV